MGQFIRGQGFSQELYDRFGHNLRRETIKLAHWLEEGHISHSGRKIGLELEGWLIDEHGSPAAENEKILSLVNDPLVVPELSQYNFEINTHPLDAGHLSLSRLHKNLQSTWDNVTKTCQSQGLKNVMIGSLPSLEKSHLSLAKMSPQDRYRMLNEQVMRLRHNNPIQLKIQGQDHLDTTHNDVMLEAASTSMQIHLQVPFDEFNKYFNASILASPFCVAVAANAPFIFEHNLWDDSRIPVVERSLALPGFHDLSGYLVQRVNFCSGFLQKSVMSCFLENLEAFPVILPLADDKRSEEELFHLKLHNGTIWRWNRPIVGADEQGQPTIRIEHRVMSAGPSIPDMIANVAFYLGLVEVFARKIESNPSLFLEDFHRTRSNFYQAAQFGINAPYLDEHKNLGSIGSYMTKEFFKEIKNGLEKQSYQIEDIKTYLDDIMYPRIQKQVTGAIFQREQAERFKNPREMVLDYHRLQESGSPICEW